MFRLVFIAVVRFPVAGGPPASHPRVSRRMALSLLSLRRGLSPVRYPPARHMLRAQLHDDLPMREGWFKPAREIVPGALWSEWLLLGGIHGDSWLCTA